MPQAGAGCRAGRGKGMAYLEDLLSRWPEWRDLVLNRLLEWATSPKFYGQVGAIVLCFLLAPPLAAFLKKRLLALKLSEPGPALIRRAGRLVESLTDLMRPIMLVALLAVAATVADAALGASWLVRLAQSVVLVWLLYEAINRYITHPILRSAGIWVGSVVLQLGAITQVSPRLPLNNST